MARRELPELPDPPKPDEEPVEEPEASDDLVIEDRSKATATDEPEPAPVPDAEADAEPEPDDEPAMETGTEALRTRLAQTEQELAGCKEKWQRTMADFDNYRKRTARDRQLDQVRGKARLMGQLLEVLDIFDKALEVEYKTVDQSRDGIIRILTQMTKVLKAEGLEPIPSVGQPFNTGLHEALTTMESAEVEPDTIVEEAVRGYTLKGELLRPAQVIVARAPAGKVTKKSKFSRSRKNTDKSEPKN